jgi:hypothetical protein
MVVFEGHMGRTIGPPWRLTAVPDCRLCEIARPVPDTREIPYNPHMTTEPHPQARRRVAFHEAGHAVIAWALGLEVGWVRLLPDTDNSAGKIDRQTANHLPSEDQIAVLVGGWCGAEISGVPQLYPAEFDTDLAQIFGVMFRSYPDDDAAQDALRERGIARVQELADQYEDSIRLIADELERRGELLAGEVAHLLSPREPPQTAR